MSFAYGFGLPHWHPLSGAFSPLSLFSGGVQGAFYDPSDPTVLFSDRAGTTPCGTPGGGSVVPVGAMLDERAPGYSVYFDGNGDYLTSDGSAGFAFGTGDFTVEFWIYFASVTNQQNIIDFRGSAGIGNGLVIYKDGSNQLAVFTGGSTVIVGPALSAGVWYHIALARSGTSTKLFLNGSQVGSTFNDTTNYTAGTNAPSIGSSFASFYVNGYISNVRIVKGTAVYTGNFTPPTSPLSPITGTSLLTCGTSWSGNPAITKNGDARVDGLNPFTASPVGNHAIAANDTTARPELSARVNLLTYSEQFDNAAWGKNQVTITANTTVAPDGTTTADTLTATATNNYHSVGANALSGSAITLTASVYVKAGTCNFVGLSAGNGAGNWATIIADLSTGTITKTQASNYTISASSITNVGSGWYQLVMTFVCTTAGASVGVQLNSSNNPTLVNFGTESWSAAGTETAYIWGADLRPTNIGTTIPAYQRVADQYTYDNVGFPRYLVANGTSSAMSTPGNVNLSGTDKATVFAGVRKLSDAAAAILVELTTNGYSNNGGFYISAPNISAANYAFTTKDSYYEPSGYVAPLTNVLACAYNLAGATRADEIIPRINGVVNQTGGAGTGTTTGNFANAPLFIGARNNGTGGFFLNGNIYSLIVVGSAVSAGNITATESWVNNKVGGAY